MSNFKTSTENKPKCLDQSKQQFSIIFPVNFTTSSVKCICKDYVPNINSVWQSTPTMTCNVILTSSQDIYYPGQTVSGIVACTFGIEEEIRGIRVKLRGKEHTDYVERKQYFDSVENKVKRKDVHYMGGNRFLEIVYNLVGEGTTSEGHYEYPFTFTLPEDLPSSYQGKYGYIQYYIKANVDIPFAVDYRGKVDFDVHSPIDFNKVLSELPMNPETYQNQKTLGFCCWASEPISMVVNLKKRAFVEGEVAKIIVDVTNLAEKPVEQLIVKITRTIEAKSYHKNNQYRYEYLVLASAIDTGVGAKGQRNYEFNLEIPRTGAVYNLTRCKNLKQWFTLSVKAVLPKFHRDMEIETKLILGHIPIRTFTELQDYSYRSAPSSRSSYTISPPTYNNAVWNSPEAHYRPSAPS